MSNKSEATWHPNLGANGVEPIVSRANYDELERVARNIAQQHAETENELAEAERERDEARAERDALETARRAAPHEARCAWRETAPSGMRLNKCNCWKAVIVPRSEAAVVSEFTRLASSEQRRQPAYGYTREHDAEHGIEHLMLQAVRLVAEDKPIKAYAMILAARNLTADTNPKG